MLERIYSQVDEYDPFLVLKDFDVTCLCGRINKDDCHLGYAKKRRDAKEKAGDNDKTTLNWVLKIELDSMYAEAKALVRRHVEL